MVLDSLLIFATAPGTGGQAASVSAPGSLTLQPDEDPVLLFGLAMFQAVNSRMVLTNPSAHDTTAGFQVGGGHTTAAARLIVRPLPKVSRGETLNAMFFGSATAGDLEMVSLTIGYPNQPGAEFVSARGIEDQVVNVTTAYFSALQASATGVWPSGQALSTAHPNLRPNGRYAIIGAEVGNADNILGLAVVGPDTGWYRQLWPVVSQSTKSLAPADTLLQVGLYTGGPVVPVIRGGNASQTFFGLMGNENATTRSVAVKLALLK